MSNSSAIKMSKGVKKSWQFSTEALLLHWWVWTYDCVAGEGYLDAANSGTLLWDPKVVENLTDEECKCITKLHGPHIACYNCTVRIWEKSSFKWRLSCL